MLDIKFIRENEKAVKKAIKDKGMELELGELLDVDEKRRKLQNEIDEQRSELKKSSKAKPGPEEIEKLKKLGDAIKEDEAKFAKLENEFRELMLIVPNIPSADSPIGGEKDFIVVDEWGEKPEFDFDIKDHIELGKSLDILDLERGVKVAGFRGYFLKNEGLLMHLGLMNLALKKLIEKGFTPMQTPTMVKEFALVGSGHFPFGRQEIYEVEEFNDKVKEVKYLAGTAEPSLLAYHADEVLDIKQLPIKLCGISPCYRREVGGYGKDTRGIYRVHEFMKVEQVVICKADLEESEKLFLEINNSARELLRELELPHRVIQIATGDMGAGKYKMYDIESWFPARKAYGETHSNSNLTDWQARRLNIRYREKNETKFAFTLNNTMIASPRILIALLENNQQEDGSIKIPKVLQEFVGKEVISR
ncbi:MAG: serine--tRNA ligase [Candidatus Doudnabacteria bacterium RIFCSPHIGHO2_01_FULL_46_14]|uniref:Serine--tRNA ligase n=1 Tax=Candidatus Doudnabacteria bacterium RIFCSPHIGHO2_01_FULL_46_14 TaxID=1817824 RepID=A0A1F5NNU0_9BACT|nr:MAG: serine--tRNA ligase [Candidatus Doudnabacteria bacterium RIFCSPHIGHO2_01_FULL_46_14]